MKKLSRRDILSALTTGLTTGIIAWRIIVFLDLALPLDVPAVLLVPVIPVLWVLGVQLGYALAVIWRPMAQFGRFATIGFANAAVDFGVLYVLIGWSGVATGVAYAAFKAFSFTVASTHSYFWNKFWAFNAGASRGGKQEVLRFISVILLAVLVNTVAATAVVLLRPETFAPETWAGVGAIAGSAAALIFSFAGFRAFVFRKKRV